AQLGGNPWDTFYPALQDDSNGGAFTIVTGSTLGQFRDTWAASFVREPARGPLWDVVGQGVPDVAYGALHRVLVAGDVASLTPGPMSSWLEHFTIDAPFVRITGNQSAYGLVGW